MSSLPVTRDESALADLVRRLAPLGPQLVALEATGGYEVVVAAMLAAAALPVVVINPRQIREFARSAGRLAKTDTLAARALAPFAAAKGLITGRWDERRAEEPFAQGRYYRISGVGQRVLREAEAALIPALRQAAGRSHT